MSNAPAPRPQTRLESASLAVLGLLALGVRLRLILAYPAIHGDDSVARLANSDSLLLGHQLPLPQLLVFVTRWANPDRFWTRLVFALVGALVPVALSRLLARFTDLATAVAAGLLLALHPLFVYYSIVPYQESLALLFVLLALTALLDAHDRTAGLALGLACLCRYEAWIAAALVVLARRDRALPALGLFGWAPLVWIGVWRSLSPPGSYVLDIAGIGSSAARLSYLGSKLAEYSGWPLLLLGGAGLLRLSLRSDARWRWGGGYVLLFLLVVTALGHEHPPGSGLVSERLVHVPALALCASAAVALGDVWRSGNRVRRLVALLAMLAIAARFVPRGEALVAAANTDASLRLALQIARFADSELLPGEHLAVRAPLVSERALADYVERVARAGGDAASARETARRLSRHAPDADRIAAHLARPPHTVVGPAEPAALLAVYDDAADVSPPAGPSIARFQEGSRAVTLYSTR